MELAHFETRVEQQIGPLDQCTKALVWDLWHALKKTNAENGRLKQDISDIGASRLVIQMEGLLVENERLQKVVKLLEAEIDRMRPRVSL